MSRVSAAQGAWSKQKVGPVGQSFTSELANMQFTAYNAIRKSELLTAYLSEAHPAILAPGGAGNSCKQLIKVLCISLSFDMQE